jgi:hypothetical protein
MVEQAFCERERHGGVVRPLTGFQPKWASAHHVLDQGVLEASA